MLDGVQDAVADYTRGLLLQVPLWLILTGFGLLLLAVLVKVARSDQSEFLWGLIKTRNDEALRELVRTQDQDVRILSGLIPLMNFLHSELIDVMEDIGVQPDRAAGSIAKLQAATLAGITHVIRSPGYHRSAIFYPQIKDGRTVLAIGQSQGFSARAQEFLTFGPDTIAWRVYTSGEHYYCQDTASDRLFVRNQFSTHDYRSFLCLPIRTRRRNLGVLVIDAVPSNGFSKDDINTLHAFARFCAVLRQTQLMIELQVEEVAPHEEDARPAGDH